MDEEDIIKWQDTLDLILAGRGEGLKCPFCEQGTIQVTQKERVTHIECPSCRRFVDGSFTGE